MRDKIYRAGLLPYVIENGEIFFLFMRPSDPRYGGDCFQIAKGKVEAGETNETAAIREASEELGLIPQNISHMWFLGNFLGRTSVFVASVADKHNFTEPHFETSETAWMSLNDYRSVGRELHYPIVEKAANMVLTLRQGIR